MRRWLPGPLIKTLIFTIIVPGSVTVGIPYLLLSPAWRDHAAGVRGARLLGLIPIAIGALGYLWCALDFATVGRGTPAPVDPPKRLVARGLYRWVRNPMYLSVTLVIFGEAVLFGSPPLLTYLLIFPIVAHLFVVFYEEPVLRKKFGASYEDYTKTVPRWLPRVKN